MNTLPLPQASATHRHARTLAAVAIGLGVYGLWSLAESWPGDATDWLSLTALVAQIGLALTGGIWLPVRRRHTGRHRPGPFGTCHRHQPDGPGHDRLVSPSHGLAKKSRDYFCC